MSEPRAFKIVISGVSSVVAAVLLTTAEAYARSKAAEGVTLDVRNLAEAEYATTDFKAVSRIEGGKEDAAVYPFVITVGDSVETRLATSQAVATKFAEEKLQEIAGFTVEPLPVTEYATTDWTSMITLEEPEAGKKRGRKSAADKAAEAEQAGDAEKQTDISGIPGMDA